MLAGVGRREESPAELVESGGAVAALNSYARLAAQQKGQYLPGQYGLNAGVMPSPGFTYANIDVNYSTGTINDSNGNGHSGPGNTNFSLWVVENDPPTFVVVSKMMVLQMPMKNSTRFDPEKTNIYKRATQTFDLFLAPKMKDVLDRIPTDIPVDSYDFSIVNPLNSGAGGKERSEAIEYLFPKNLAQKFASSEITNQELIDMGQVLVNGVRIALNLQLVE